MEVATASDRAGTGFGDFDFGLSEAEEAHAQRLHTSSIVIDLVYWGPVGYRCFPPALTADIARRCEAVSSGPQIVQMLATEILRGCEDDGALGYREAWDASGVTAGCRPVGLDNQQAMATGFGFQQAQFDRLPWLVKALRADDFRRAKANGQHAGWINTQNVGPLTVELLSAVYNMGLRMLMLTYNSMNHLGAGCTERTDAGISNYGAKVIARANELGIILDTAHCGRQTTLDCCALSRAPVVASHTSAMALFPHDRAKTDEELRAVAATGGVIGVVTVPFFLGNTETVTITSMLDHVDFIAGLVGWQHVAIGSDWPMPFTKAAVSRFFTADSQETMGFRPEHNIRPEMNLVGFDDYRDFPNITRGLVKRGYTDEQIRGILGENFLRVFERVCG